MDIYTEIKKVMTRTESTDISIFFTNIEYKEAFIFIFFIVYLSSFRYILSLKGYRFLTCKFVKVLTFLREILCLKNQEVEFSQNESNITI